MVIRVMEWMATTLGERVYGKKRNEIKSQNLLQNKYCVGGRGGGRKRGQLTQGQVWMRATLQLFCATKSECGWARPHLRRPQEHAADTETYREVTTHVIRDEHTAKSCRVRGEPQG